MSIGESDRPLWRTVAQAAVGALVLGIAAGCATPAVVESVGFDVVTAENRTMPPDALMRPGTRVKLDRIRLTDSQGASRQPETAGEVSVEVRGGTYDATTGEIVFSDRRDAVPPEGYEVVVSHPDGARSVQRFKADFALVDGPDAPDVESFRIALLWRRDGTPYEIPAGTPLIPGAEYEIRAVANDVHGRRFSSTDDNYPLPPDRLEMTLTGFRARRSGYDRPRRPLRRPLPARDLRGDGRLRRRHPACRDTVVPVRSRHRGRA